MYKLPRGQSVTVAKGTLASVTALAAIAASVLGVAPGAYAEPDPIGIQPLTERHTFTDDVTAQITLTPDGLPQIPIDLDDGSNVLVVELTVQPGVMLPWHTHPALSFGAITEGEFVYIFADDCVERSFPAGTAFVDPGFGNVHMALNPSTENETVVVATFIGAPDEGPLTLPVDEGEAAALDQECGIDREDVASAD